MISRCWPDHGGALHHLTACELDVHAKQTELALTRSCSGDSADAIDELGAEEDVGVVEHAFL